MCFIFIDITFEVLVAMQILCVVCVCVCVSECVCVCVRERERERECVCGFRTQYHFSTTYSSSHIVFTNKFKNPLYDVTTVAIRIPYV